MSDITTKKDIKGEITAYILDFIKMNKLQPGEKLPSQAELVKQLKVSRTAVRETVIELEGKDIIQVINGKGMYVKDPSENHLLSGLELERKKENLIDVLEVRWALEIEIIKNVIKNATDEELASINRIVTELMEKYNHDELQNKIDKQFHYAIYDICHNKILKELIVSLGYLTDELWDFPLGLDHPFTATIPFHEKMYKALVKRDFRLAKHYNDSIFIQMIEEINELHRKD